MPPPAGLTDEIEVELRRWCADHDLSISPLGDVDEATAAGLLHRSKSALRQQHSEGRWLVKPSRIDCGHRLYSIRAIARYHAQNAQNAQFVTGADRPSD